MRPTTPHEAALCTAQREPSAGCQTAVSPTPSRPGARPRGGCAEQNQRPLHLRGQAGWQPAQRQAGSLRYLLAGLGLAAVLLLNGQVSAEEGASGKTLYQNHFDQAPVDKVPEEFLVLAGAFAVKEEAGNKFLELPGSPVDDFGVLFGPTESSNVALSARIRGTGKGRRFPAFAVGLGGVGGFKLQVAPAKKALELYKADDVVQSIPFVWTPASWTQLRIQVRKVKEGEWKVEGKAWKEGDAEPTGWMIAQTETAEPAGGRALVSGNPFSGNPIHFDDLVVSQLPIKP